jgi:hypothetical protein
MELAQQVDIADVERYVADIGAAIGSVDLTYPALLRGRGVGAEAAFVQFLLTWANRSDSRKLVLLDTLPIDEYGDRLAERISGRVAALVCTSARRRRGDNDYARRVKGVTERALLDNYYNSSIGRHNVSGRSIAVLCADTSGFGEPRSVYDINLTGGWEVKDPLGFESIVENALSALIFDVYDRGLSVDKEFTQAAASLLFELFSNTHDHARSGFSGEPLSSSCRGFQIRVVEAEDRVLLAAAQGYAPLQVYLEGLPSGRGHHRHILEISVFDAGLGFAQQLTKTTLTNLALADERAAVDRCFAKGVTTKSHRRYGRGLPQVITLLRQRRGFIRLRTGRLSLSRDLSLEASRSRDEIPSFEEWHPTNASACAPIQGSCLTVLMPIEKLFR